MKKFIRTLLIACFVCMMANIFSVTASASSSEPRRIVRIKNMWNSNYMVNDNGVGKYSPSNVGEDCVWTITQSSLTSYYIQNFDGSYLRANENGTVTCETNPNFNPEFQWYLSSTNDGKYWIKSYAYTNKAINIENLTGSLQLTNYYDTWESAKWILEDVSGPEFNTNTNNVIFQTPDQQKYLFDGATIGYTATTQAFINGNMLYQIIDKGDYCYIKYNPVAGSSLGYFKASSSNNYAFSSTVDDTSIDYRWKIEKNTDGTTSIVSVAYPGKCISSIGSYSLVEQANSGDESKWNMHPANSLMIRITNSDRTNTLALNDSDKEKAIFKYNGNTPLTSSDAKWQVIYNNGRMYLKNVLTGKYLRTSGVEGDTQAYVKDYNINNDNLYVWNPAALRYSLGLYQNNNLYLHPDYPGSSVSSTETVNAVASNANYYQTLLDYAIVGFAY